MPTVTKTLEPDRACSTSGSASKSLTLETLLDLKSSTTLGGGRGWEDMVPQLTPMAPAVQPRRHGMVNNRKGMKRLGGIL